MKFSSLARLIKFISIAAAQLGCLVLAQPAYNPVGPQTGVPVATVSSGGWTECHKSLYGTPLRDTAALLAGCQGDQMMLACRPTGNATLTLLAQAKRSDVVFDTGNNTNVTHEANGAAWYYSPQLGSWGFAQAGASVFKYQCDIGSPNPQETRLCWHTEFVASTFNVGGFRCGATELINGSTAWERIVYVAKSDIVRFSPPADLVVGSPLPITAFSDSGQPVSLSSTTPEVCTLSGNSGAETLLAAQLGNCNVVASVVGGNASAQLTLPVGLRTLDVRTYVPHAAANSGFSSYVRVINNGKVATALSVAVIDEVTGSISPLKRLPLGVASGGAAIFSSQQIEAALNLSPAMASSSRPRIRVRAGEAVPIEVQSLLRSPKSIFSEVSGAQVSPANGVPINVRTFVPSASGAYNTTLRLINTGAAATAVTVARIDPLTGIVSTAGTLVNSLQPGAAASLSAGQVEAALGFKLAATDRPRIQLTAPSSKLEVQTFMAQPGGAGFTEVSGAQTGSSIEVRNYQSAATPGYTSFVRIINASINPGAAANAAANASATVGITNGPSPITATLLDAAGRTLATANLTSSLAAAAVITLNSKEIETALGYAIPVGIAGPSGSMPRLVISSNGVPLEVQSYVLQPNAWFTTGSSAAVGKRAVVRLYVPQIDAGGGYSSVLRITNTGMDATTVNAVIIDDITGTTNNQPAGVVLMDNLPAGATRTVNAAQLEAAFGIGLGNASIRRINSGSRPRIALSSTQVLHVQSFMQQPDGVMMEFSDGQ